jgi:hypothetical protein
MKSIPFFNSYDPLTKQLTLRGASYIPEEIFAYADQIEILDAAKGSLCSLPANFSQLKKLKAAFFSQNDFTSIPEVLGECERLDIVGFKSCRIVEVPESALPGTLRWLILTDNKIKTLPQSIGSLHKLRKLALAGNQLETLPDTMKNCQSLELLRVGANNFREPVPAWVFELPAMAWYCDSGNPFCDVDAPALSSEFISFLDICYGEQIGSSPTSKVFSATLKSSGRSVAVKHYASALTSDGYALDDMRAYLAIDEHPNLIKALGRLSGHPDNINGLVLSLIPSEFKSLGLPPNFVTCTRDTFPLENRFSFPFMHQVLSDTAAALTHLHEKNISHGDVYAHNILSNSSGRSVLGDFGAASFFNSNQKRLRERLEVRAFGNLIEDLVGQHGSECKLNEIEKLKCLEVFCTGATALEYPTMEEVHSILKGF